MCTVAFFFHYLLLSFEWAAAAVAYILFSHSNQNNPTTRIKLLPDCIAVSFFIFRLPPMDGNNNTQNNKQTNEQTNQTNEEYENTNENHN